MSEAVYILGTFSTPFRRWPDKGFKELTRDAYLCAVQDAGLADPQVIEAAWFGNCVMHYWGQPLVRGNVAFIFVQHGFFSPGGGDLLGVGAGEVPAGDVLVVALRAEGRAQAQGVGPLGEGGGLRGVAGGEAQAAAGQLHVAEDLAERVDGHLRAVAVDLGDAGLLVFGDAQFLRDAGVGEGPDAEALGFELGEAFVLFLREGRLHEFDSFFHGLDLGLKAFEGVLIAATAAEIDISTGLVLRNR